MDALTRTLSVSLLVIVALYLGVGALLFAAQRSLLYFPRPQVYDEFHNEVFNHDGQSINVIVVNSNQSDAIMYFGGNGEPVGHNAPTFSTMFPKQTIYLVNYRGYGGSSGSPNEKGIYSDALYIFDEVRRLHSKITVIGRSLGSGVATLLAARRDLEKLVLVTPFDSIENVAQGRFPIYPMSLLLKDKYDSVGRAGEIEERILVLIAEFDNVVPIGSTENLVRAFDSGQVASHVIANTGHNTISQSPQYWTLLADFVANSADK